KERCGFDPLGIERVTLALWHLQSSPWSAVFVARGIDPARLEACLQGELRAAATRDGAMWHVVADYMQPIELAALGTTVIAYIAPDASAATLDALLRSGAPLRRSHKFDHLLSEIPDDAATWAVGILADWEVRSFSAAIVFDDGMTTTAHLTLPTP